MIPTYPYSLSSSSPSLSPPNSPSPMPILDLNVEDNNHDLIFSPTHQPSSSSSSLSYPILFNPSQDHSGSSYWESKRFQSIHDEAGKNIIEASSGSWNDPEEKGAVEIRKKGLKLRVWKRSGPEREDENNNHHQGEEDIDSSVKWMPSKMRMMRKMMASSDQKASDINTPPVPVGSTSRQNPEDQNQNQQPLLLSPRGTDNSSSSSNNSSTHNNSNNNNDITVRVCADCNTTKTPLWRSGPRGPKSLCNACGIRQRKARRAATANGSGDPAGEKSAMKGNHKFHNKEKKSKMEHCETPVMMKKKKKQKHLQDEAKPVASSRGRIINKFSFEDFTVAAASKVFPQDEKEAAILLMALSCNGLVHG